MLWHQFPLVRPSDKAQVMQLWYWHLHHIQPLVSREQVGSGGTSFRNDLEATLKADPGNP